MSIPITYELWPMTQILFSILRILIVAFILFSLFLFFFQESLIFFPTPLRHSPAKYSGHLMAVDHEGVQLKGWLLPAADPATAPLVIYYGGNAEEVSTNLEDHGRFDRDISLALFNYRGYGESEGKPSQEALCKDALFLYDRLTEKIKPSRILVMGRSLGSGVAVHVAAERQVDGAILVTPFDSLTNVAKHHYPFVPVRLMLRHPFDSLSLAPKLQLPMLALMAGRDTIVPNRHTENLVSHWAGPTELVTIARAGHNDISFSREYWKAISRFLKTIQ